MTNKPTGVPASAFWDEDDSEWVSAPRDASGEFHGLVSYFRPDGTLCCTTNFSAGTPHGEFRRFHENGEVSRSGSYSHGKLEGTNRFARCTTESSETFPRGLGPLIWSCEMDYRQGDVVEGRLFDRQGRRVMENGEPFPDTRPHGVAADAHFRKPAGREDYCWVSGTSRVDNDGEVVRLGIWHTWTAAGTLIVQEPYDGDGRLHGVLNHYDEHTGQLTLSIEFDHGQRIYQRPTGVPTEAAFDEDEELWMTEAPKDAEGRAHGHARAWDACGRLRRIKAFEQGRITRFQELLASGAVGQDSTFIHDGVPQRKSFRRSDTEELDSFPGVSEQHPSARQVEYLFDSHGFMTGYTIFDETGAVLEGESLYRNAGNDTEQRRFDSIEAASRAWIEEGDRYTTALNAWLAELYDTGEPSQEEPTFCDDLERAAVESVETLNRRGDGAAARSLFPRYYDGVGGAFWHKYGLVVDRVLHAGSAIYGRVQAADGDASVMQFVDGVLETLPGILAMGSSTDKRFLAWAYDDKITVVDSTSMRDFAYPTRYGHAGADALGGAALGKGGAMAVRDIRVLPGGRELVLVSAEGIYLLGENKSERIYPLDADMDTYVEHFTPVAGAAFNLEMSFANADVSPKGTLITCGGMFRRGNMAGLVIWGYEGGVLVLKNTSKADAFFPAQAVFHRERASIAFAATLYASLSNPGFANTTFRIDLPGLEDGEITDFAGGVAQERGVVNTVASFGHGFLLGYDNGYVRWMGLEENAQLLGYLFVGGSILHIDVDPDQRGFAVASDSGLIAEYRLSDTTSRNLVTTMPLEDRRSAALFRTFEPMIW